MKNFAFASLVAVGLSSPAVAGVYVTGSLAGSTTSMPYSSYQSQYSSGSIGFDIGSILRLSYSYSQEDSTNTGFTDPRSDADLSSANATERANANDDPSDDGNLVAYKSTSRVIGNSVDLQLVIYKGDIFVPFITGGVIQKRTSVTTEQDGKAPQIVRGVSLGPQAGAGVGIRLNRQFTLKVSYVVSPGQTREPGEVKAHNIWDRKVTFGLSYEL